MISVPVLCIEARRDAEARTDFRLDGRAQAADGLLHNLHPQAGLRIGHTLKGGVRDAGSGNPNLF
jgi:hypothetical protein